MVNGTRTLLLHLGALEWPWPAFGLTKVWEICLNYLLSIHRFSPAVNKRAPGKQPNPTRAKHRKTGGTKRRGGVNTTNMHWQTNLTSFCILHMKLYPPVQKQPTSRCADVSVLSQSGVGYKQLIRTACVFSLCTECAQVQSETFTAIFCLYPGVREGAGGGCGLMRYSFINEPRLLNQLGFTSKELNRFHIEAELCLRQMLITHPSRLHADEHSKEK